MNSYVEKALVAILLQVTVAGGFFLAERYVASNTVPPPFWLVTRIDGWLPLVPATVWFYISWYPAPLAILLTERSKFRHGSFAILTAFALCMVGYALVPISISRPALDHAAGISGDLLRAVYTIDQPVNLFPSFHAAAAAIVVLVFFDRMRFRYPLLLWLFGVCASCVLTKQHYVLDVLVGVLIGGISHGLTSGLSWEPNPSYVTVKPASTD